MIKQQLNVDSYEFVLSKLMSEFSLTEQQVYQYERYVSMLIEWNEKFNLTAILDPIKIVQLHLHDSLALSHFIDFKTASITADVGTGAGFPGMPLKILFPHLTVILIEVNKKKQDFLIHVAQQLGLENVAIYPLDWRTFLRETAYSVDYFFARASLQPQELLRIFKGSSPYQHAKLVYWASAQWVAGKQEALYKEKEEEYSVGDVRRKYIFFSKTGK